MRFDVNIKDDSVVYVQRTAISVRVVHAWGDGEQWVSRTYYPMTTLRALRRLGVRTADVIEPLSGEHYDGPGRPFARRPYVVRVGRCVVMIESGGLDV